MKVAVTYYTHFLALSKEVKCKLRQHFLTTSATEIEEAMTFKNPTSL